MHINQLNMAIHAETGHDRIVIKPVSEGISKYARFLAIGIFILETLLTKPN